MDINQLHQNASEYLIEGEADKAEELYKKILELVPNDEAALSALMDIYQENNKFQYYLTRANYNIANGKLEYGINDCKKALNIESESIEAREKLARLYKVTNNPLKAIDEFSKIIEIAPEHFPSYFELIDLYSRENALESAIEIALRGKEEFKRSELNFDDILGKLYFDLGDYKNALKSAQDKGLRIKILLQSEKNEEAKVLLDEINIDDINLNKEQKALYCMLWAQYYYNTRNFESAFDYINKYAEILGPTPISFQMKALCYEEMDDSFMAAYNFGYMNKALNKQDEALVEFNNAYNLNPTNKDVLIELAKLYEQNKEKYTAIDYWQKVYELDEDESARQILMDFYLKEGDNLMAQKYGAEIKTNSTNEYTAPTEEDEGILNKILNLFSKK